MTSQWSLLDKTNLQCPDGNATIYGETGSYSNPSALITSVCLKCGDKEMGCVNSSSKGSATYSFTSPKDINYYNYPLASNGYSKFIRFMNAGRADGQNGVGGLIENVMTNTHCENGFNGFNVERFQNPADSTNIALANFKPLCYTPSSNTDSGSSGSDSGSSNTDSGSSNTDSGSSNTDSGSSSSDSGTYDSGNVLYLLLFIIVAIVIAMLIIRYNNQKMQQYQQLNNQTMQ